MNYVKTRKQHAFFPLLEKFISESKNGKRLQPNGKRISVGTIRNYKCTFQLLRKFSAEKNFDLRIREERLLNTRETQSEQIYWKKF